MSKPIKDTGSDTDLVQCPYNEHHLIMRKRFQVHLVRCRRSFPNAEMAICPFNVTHRVNKLELEWHVSSCAERQSFENFRHRPAAIQGLTSSNDRTFCDTESMPPSVSSNMERDFSIVGGDFMDDDPSELWDTDVEVPAYNPHDYASKADILRMPVGLTPSQRNSFRLAERKRLRALVNERIDWKRFE